MVLEPTAGAFGALAEGRWRDARTTFEAALAAGETAEACFGLAMALWWQGENHACVERCSRAYALFRESGDVQSAAQCAVWLAITYKANFANFAAANGWIGRAERLLEPLDPGPLHGWVWVARAYRMTDLDAAEELTERAVAVARAASDVDLELVALAQLGLVRVGKGDIEAGFGLIDEAMAAALAGERSTLDTVVYACCDMLNACELASDLERAAQWCQVADDFVAKYGCPFLYAECRIYYGSVLTAKGRWSDAERELGAGVRITEGACPGLHRRAMARLAELRVRQGRLEAAEVLLANLGEGINVEAEATLLTAALSLARGDAPAAGRLLEQRLRHLEDHRWHLAGGLDLLVGAYVAGGQLEAAAGAAERLTATADAAASPFLSALAASARGRVLLAHGDPRGVTDLETALKVWSSMELPLEAARTRFELARALAASEPDAAVDQARRALRAFEDLGASIDADGAAAFLRSVGVVPRTGPKRAGVLTMREREVLRLLGAGLSNPEIAERLHVSRKTASHHVSSILTKLGLRNRAEAAAHATAVLGDADGLVAHRT
ncbi:MAG TPA: LuxR C-terminal-related transcriptional regulator [Acidimicrobiales bacterium]|nr:LuxR C-terminal-related transcriptional regulator [Acidimicrobiales bacterium]